MEINNNMDIKDYLHLFLGCNVLMSDGKNILPLTGISGSLAISDFIEGAELNLIHIPIHTCRPILRPLSDLSREELEEILVTGDHLNPGGQSPKEFVIGWKAFTPRTFNYLLSKHFDLFGLIEAGLAIDATTLKEVTNGK